MLVKKTMLHKNWPNICQLADPQMRIVVSLCQEPATLSMLAIMLPDCFSNTKTTLCIPQSAIMWLSKQYAVDQNLTPAYQELYSKFRWQKACNALGVQMERYRRPNGLIKSDEQDVYRQIHDQIPKSGMSVVWNGKPYIVVQIEIRIEDEFKPLPHSWQPPNLMLVPAKNIDRNS